MQTAFRHWNEGMSDRAIAAFERSRGLLRSTAPSPNVAYVTSRLAVNAALRGEFEVAIELCESALAIADAHGLEDIRGHVLNTRGFARVSHRGDPGGLADLEASLEIAERLNAANAIIRGYKNLASTLAEMGELPRAAELEQGGADAARRFGADFQLMWFETELAILGYWSGEWDASEETFARLERWVADVGPHYMEAAARSCRAKVRAARGDRPGALADIESALDFARRSREPQMLLPTLADAALAATSAGGGEAARQVAALFDELVAATGGAAEGSSWSTAFALALALTDQVERFAAVTVEGPSRWLVVARLIAAKRYDEAADELAALGARPEEALARLLSARARIGHGHRAGGEAELRRAIGFWNRVGATHLTAMAEAMLAKTA